jgi:hypothetical protein
VRFWIGEVPDAHYASTKVIHHAAAARVEVPAAPRFVALEIFVPSGPRWLYGMLGGRWRSDGGGALKVSAEVAAVSGRLFPQHLAISGDQVRVGLLAEHARGIVAGVQIVERSVAGLPMGELTLDVASHGAVGSNPTIYKHIVAILLQLIRTRYREPREPAEEELAALLPSTFT